LSPMLGRREAGLKSRNFRVIIVSRFAVVKQYPFMSF
jgi:hypothetical protein